MSQHVRDNRRPFTCSTAKKVRILFAHALSLQACPSVHGISRLASPLPLRSSSPLSNHARTRRQLYWANVKLGNAPALWVWGFPRRRLGWILRPRVVGWTSPEGTSNATSFSPEGMRRSKVHAAGVLRMKQAAYYHNLALVRVLAFPSLLPDSREGKGKQGLGRDPNKRK